MDTERAFLLALLAVALYASTVVLWPFFTYIVLAILLAYTLFPFQRRLAPRIGPRKSAIVLMTAATLLFLFPLLLLLRVVVRQALAAAEGIRTADVGAEIENVRQLLIETVGVDPREVFIEAFGANPQEYVGQAIQELAGVAQSGAQQLFQGASGFLGGVSRMFLGVTVFGFTLYYLLVAGDSTVRWFRAAVPLPEAVQDELLAALDRLTYAVLITQGVIAVVQAALTGLALFVLGFSNVLFWTVLAVVLGLLPLVGSMFIWIPAALYLLAIGDVVGGTGLLVYGFGLINLTDNYLRPVIGGRSANLNPAILVVGIFGGLAVFGFMGIFVGPIVLGFTKVLVAVVAREYGDEQSDRLDGVLAETVGVREPDRSPAVADGDATEPTAPTDDSDGSSSPDSIDDRGSDDVADSDSDASGAERDDE
ncbi:AI-2E family transporter [Halobacteriales archaeon QS_1_67_19]|nr:MAG: AI-2E family transporter [Halobacteriales archaeon QS_1_67_19]